MRPCIICYREKCDGFYYEIWEGGYCHYRFANRNCSIGKDYDKLIEEQGDKCGYMLKKIRCEMMDDNIYNNRFDVRRTEVLGS